MALNHPKPLTTIHKNTPSFVRKHVAFWFIFSAKNVNLTQRVWNWPRHLNIFITPEAKGKQAKISSLCIIVGFEQIAWT